MSKHKDTTWIALYKGAMLEFDPQRLREGISLANDAIKQCLARIEPCKDNHRLKRDLANASRNSRVLAFLR
jgi:hypothetical protein